MSFEYGYDPQKAGKTTKYGYDLKAIREQKEAQRSAAKAPQAPKPTEAIGGAPAPEAQDTEETTRNLTASITTTMLLDTDPAWDDPADFLDDDDDEFDDSDPFAD